MAALNGLGIDNCRVEVDGPEVPNLDGSAAPFVCLIHEAGVQVQRAGKRYLVIEKAVETLADASSHRIVRISVRTEADGARAGMPILGIAEGRCA